MKEVAERVIVSDPDVMNGTPCFRGTRVPFKNLIDYPQGGHPLGEFLRQFPRSRRDMAVQALRKRRNLCSPKSHVGTPRECLPPGFRHELRGHEAHTV
jgi:uncharacterized protein (DUF433 family)